ncbi:hypothetical protein GCM10009037_21530 [Halarchaeum grantii]|uniref:Uncharacterized protein n=1 Tax=Halarchaeum grantii TaxID=1193105 RepID=A0A830FB96_9EURY|nr:hypothetical protein GCM10009037_21530 [Halarchaeum grantii]
MASATTILPCGKPTGAMPTCDRCGGSPRQLWKHTERGFDGYVCAECHPAVGDGLTFVS